MQNRDKSSGSIPLTIEYIQQAIDDEIVLAKLLGWYDIERPKTLVITGFNWVWGYDGNGPYHGEPANKKPMPGWSRDWAAAGQLISQFDISTTVDADRVTVTMPSGECRSVLTRLHPTKELAIFKAICQLTINYLSKGSSEVKRY